MLGQSSILPSLAAALFVATVAGRDAAAGPDWMAFVEFPGHIRAFATTVLPPAAAPAHEDISHEELCAALVVSAREKRLPVTFFTNLIWQESRFDTDAVSPAGAEGIAQFMPAVSKVMGFDPFDPREAIPAAARLLRTLLDRFGNLGLAAAAYNAGPARVRNWMDKRSGLPEETRDYVATVTGWHAERWRTRDTLPAGFLVPPRVPCHRVAVFSEAARDEQAEAMAARAAADAAAKARAKTRLAKGRPRKATLAKRAMDKSRVAVGRKAGTRVATPAASAKVSGRAKARPAPVRSARRKDGPLG
jgi:hypothetical protein